MLQAIRGRVFGEHRVEVLGDTIRGFPTYELVPVGAGAILGFDSSSTGISPKETGATPVPVSRRPTTPAPI